MAISDDPFTLPYRIVTVSSTITVLGAQVISCRWGQPCDELLALIILAPVANDMSAWLVTIREDREDEEECNDAKCHQA